MNARANFAIQAPDRPGLRRAALALHATESHDRDWLLAQLPEADRGVLDQMLKDLAVLGLPRDQALVEELLRGDSPPAVAAVAEPSKAEQALLRLRDAAPADLASLLEREPTELAAHAITLLPNTERASILPFLSAPKRRQVQELLDTRYAVALDSGRSAHRLGQSLLKELAAALPARVPAGMFWPRSSKQLMKQFAKHFRNRS